MASFLASLYTEGALTRVSLYTEVCGASVYSGLGLLRALKLTFSVVEKEYCITSLAIEVHTSKLHGSSGSTLFKTSLSRGYRRSSAARHSSEGRTIDQESLIV